MIIFISIIIFIGILGIVAFLLKLAKEEKKYAEEELKTQQFEQKITQTSSPNIKTLNIFKEEEFEKMLSDAQKNPDKLEDLKEKIQEKLRNCLKSKDMDGARKCNMQLKKIDLHEKEGN